MISIRDNVIIGLLAICIVLLCFSLTLSVPSSINNKIVSNSSDCNNLSLINTTICLTSYVEPFYIYNRTNDNIKLTFDELKTRGGDCQSWAEYYINEFKSRGFEAEPILFDINNTNRHMIALVHDSKGYCTIDLLSYKCYEYG